MAFYIELKAGDKIIGAFGAQRQQDLTDPDLHYDYLVCRYVPSGPFGELTKSMKPEDVRMVAHVYSEGAEELARCILKAYE